MKTKLITSLVALALASGASAQLGPIIPQNTLKKAMQETYKAAQAYTDSKVTGVDSKIEQVATTKAAEALASANAYTDAEIKKVSTNGVEGLTKRVEKLEANESAMSNKVEVAVAKVGELESSITGYDDRITSNSNRINEVDTKLPVLKAEVNGYTDNQVADAKTDIITNTSKRVRAVLSEAKTYADGQISVEATRADQSAQSKVDAKATELTNTFNSKIGNIGNAADVATFVEVKANEVTATAAADATSKADAANAAAVAVAKSYTDEQVNSAVDAAQTYIDGKIAPLNTAVGDLGDKVDENKTDADAKFVALEGKVDSNKLSADTALNATNAALVTKINTDVTAAKSEASSALANARTEITDEISAAATTAKNEALADAKSYTDGKVSGVYHFKGSCTFAQLPTDGQQEADVWYVTDREMSYAWQMSGETPSWIPLGKIFDLSAYKTWTETESLVDAKISVVDGKLTILSDTVTANKTELDGEITTIKGAATELATKVDGIDTAYKAADTALKNELTPLITAAQTKADQGVTDAAAASAKVDTEVGKVTTALNATNNLLVTKINTDVAGAKTYTDDTVAPVTSRVGTLETTVAAIPGQIEAAAGAAQTYIDDKIKNLKSVITTDGSEAMIFNEADGGGTMMTLPDGTKSFVGVNDASKSQTGIAGQIYVNKGSQKTKINMYNGKFCYVKGENPVTDEAKAKREFVVVEDLGSATAGLKTEFKTTIDKTNELIVAKLGTEVAGAKTYADDKVDTAKTELTNAIATAKSEAISVAGEAVDAKISAKTGNILGTIKSYVDAKETSANGYTDNSIEALTNETGVINTRIKALADGAVAAAQTAANAADAKAVQAQVLATTAKTAAESAKSTADDALDAAAVADGKAVAAQSSANANTAKLADITGTVGTSIATAKSEAIAAAGTSTDEKVATVKTETLAVVAVSEAALSNNVVKIASDDATAKASTAKDEAISVSTYAWDETGPIASKEIDGVTYQNVYVFKNKTMTTITSNEDVITFQVPDKNGVKSIQRACSAYLEYNGVEKPTIAIVGETGQHILFGESNQYRVSDITTGKWFIYVSEVSKNVFWIQIEKFVE